MQADIFACLYLAVCLCLSVSVCLSPKTENLKITVFKYQYNFRISFLLKTRHSAQDNEKIFLIEISKEWGRERERERERELP